MTSKLVEYVALYGLNLDAFDKSGISDGTILETNWKGELLATWPVSSSLSSPQHAERPPLSPVRDGPARMPFPPNGNMFAFPHGIDLLRSAPPQPILHSFVITGTDGARCYGHCATRYVAMAQDKLATVRLQEGARVQEEEGEESGSGVPASGASTAAADLPSVLFEPQTVCLLSRRADLSRTLLATLQSAFTTLPAESDGGGIATLKDWMKQLYVVLEHAHPPVAQRNARRLDHSAHQEDAVAIAASAMDNEREEPLSPLHDGAAPAADGDDSDEADDADAIAAGARMLPRVDASFRTLCTWIEPSDIISLFSALLCEHQVLLTWGGGVSGDGSSSAVNGGDTQNRERGIGATTVDDDTKVMAATNDVAFACMEALLVLLQPLEWHYTYIPLLPSSLRDFVFAPFPFLIGTTHRTLRALPEPLPGKVLVYDLDSGELALPGQPLPSTLLSSVPRQLPFGAVAPAVAGSRQADASVGSDACSAASDVPSDVFQPLPARLGLKLFERICRAGAARTFLHERTQVGTGGVADTTDATGAESVELVRGRKATAKEKIRAQTLSEAHEQARMRAHTAGTSMAANPPDPHRRAESVPVLRRASLVQQRRLRPPLLPAGAPIVAQRMAVDLSRSYDDADKNVSGGDGGMSLNRPEHRTMSAPERKANSVLNNGALSKSSPGRADRSQSQSWAKRMARNIQDASGLGGTKPALTLQTMNILYSSDGSDAEETDKVAATAAAAAAAGLETDSDHTSGSSVSGSCSDSESTKHHSSARRKRKKKRKSQLCFNLSGLKLGDGEINASCLHMRQQLIQALTLTSRKPQTTPASSTHTHNHATSSVRLQKRLLRQAFLKCLVSLLKHFRQFVVDPTSLVDGKGLRRVRRNRDAASTWAGHGSSSPDPNNTVSARFADLSTLGVDIDQLSSQKLFDRDGFVAELQEDCIPFMRRFLVSQLFSVFVHQRVANTAAGKPMDAFDCMCLQRMQQKAVRLKFFEKKLDVSGTMWKAKRAKNAGDKPRGWKRRKFELVVDPTKSSGSRQRLLLRYFSCPALDEVQLLENRLAALHARHRATGEALTVDAIASLRNEIKLKHQAAIRGEFELERAEGIDHVGCTQVLIPSSDRARFKTPFAFVLRSRSRPDDVMCCCADSGADRRYWLLYLKSKLHTYSAISELRNFYFSAGAGGGAGGANPRARGVAHDALSHLIRQGTVGAYMEMMSQASTNITLRAPLRIRDQLARTDEETDDDLEQWRSTIELVSVKGSDFRSLYVDDDQTQDQGRTRNIFAVCVVM